MNAQSDATAALEVLRRAIDGVGDGQLGCPTPCRDYTVADLAEHVVGSVTRISAAAGVMVVAVADGPPLRQVLEVGRDAVAGWQRRGADGEVDFGGRTMAARDLLGVIALEFVVHGWDFATAVGAELVVPEGLSTHLLTLAHRTVTTESRLVAGFDPPVPVADGVGALDRLLAFTGRA
ncbi:TIGR03086 family protein [Mycobacterium hodleri]|uniref:TIGR03086 family metal-binding protein n=1 Tax=Mycolicibacterium hodleri TaxID=49897 RepID=UPI0021F251EA|nr:TIGR03086 family metal-binding protein [Mycolicibacterium hodleri]MCV7136692.1 TIGR03086 family protein [Mycolicibacterium hodleri]